MADDDGTLLPGWTAVDSGEGDYYYWNEDTDEVKWEKPVKPKPKPPGPPPRMNKPPPAPPKPSAPPKPTTPRPARTPTFAPASSSSMAAPPPASASTSRPADALAYQRQLAAEKEAQRHAAVAVREAEVQAMATQQAQRAQGASALNSYTYHGACSTRAIVSRTANPSPNPRCLHPFRPRSTSPRRVHRGHRRGSARLGGAGAEDGGVCRQAQPLQDQKAQYVDAHRRHADTRPVRRRAQVPEVRLPRRLGHAPARCAADRLRRRLHLLRQAPHQRGSAV
mmetsp:Transcript_11374/g.30616  ORF Transcript_11374/g.30616 Transcript_11374/m.30616 type:complete len:280 (-) Transcript_11374:1527-2366(-)